MNGETEKKIDELLALMTLKEKIGQLNQIIFDIHDIDGIKEKVRNGEVGSLIFAVSAFAGHDEYQMPELSVLNEIQRIAVEESPSGIPLINGRDVIHGYKTGFPIPLAMASSFNMELVEKSYRAAAEEAASEGIHWSFAPMIDVSNDPRWGRIIESAGEDPYLSGQYAVAAVKGFQGEQLSAPGSIAACAKHYIGYGASEGGRDYHRTEISDYTLRNKYLPPFREAVKAGAATVMTSFNDVSGQPVASSRYMLTDLLRSELGFRGFTISDWEAVKQLMRQGVAEDRKDCARLAINAGLDMDMVDLCYSDFLEELVNDGKVDMAAVDEAVKRVLRIKFAVGLFEHPYTKKLNVDYDKHMRIAYEIAAESIVLLKNNGVLPLCKNSNICLAGCMSDEQKALMGSWSSPEYENTVTIKNAIEKICNTGSFGCCLSSVPYELQQTLRNADIVILAIGESEKVTGEARSLCYIELPEDQIKLAKTAKRFGKKVVGVICSGRPMALESAEPYFDALLYAWHGGNMAGEAIADILFGRVCPSGKTAVTFPRRTGQVPIYYNVSSSGRPVNGYYGEEEINNYEDCLGSPMYPFGYGLSYTTFKYSDIKCNIAEMSLEELRGGKCFEVSIDVTNTGKYDGKETAQCYIRDTVSDMMRPIRELKGFKKVMIKCGETKKIIFRLGFDELGYYDRYGAFAVERGLFEIFIGPNCLTGTKITICVD